MCRFKKFILGATLLTLSVFAAFANAATLTEPFTTAVNYVLSDATISVISGGVAKLKSITELKKDDTQAEFDAGTHSLTSWQTNKVALAGPMPVVNPNGLVGYWNFDEASGTSAADLASGNNGTHTNTPTIETTGKFGKALTFNGSTQDVTIGNPTALQLTGPLTVSCWYKSTGTLGDYKVLVSKWHTGNSNAQIWLGFQAALGLYFQVTDGTTGPYCAAGSGNTYNDGNWHHAVGVWNGNKAQLYVDGVAVGTPTNSSTITLANTSLNVIIGNDNTNNADRKFPGTIDEVTIWNRALSAAEVSSLASATSGMAVLKKSSLETGTDAAIPGLLNYWKFDESNGTTAADSKGTKNGTLTGGPTIVRASKAGDYALKFDGTDDYVSVGDTANGAAGVKSVAFWMRPNVTASKKIVNIDGTKQIELNASNDVAATLFPTATVYVDGVVSSKIPDNSWHHVVITDTTGVTASSFEVGRVSTGYFDGLIDEVALFSTVLSPAQVYDLYATSGRYTSTTADQTASGTGWKALTTTSSADFGVPLEKPPVAYWKFDAGTGTTVADSGANAYDGTFGASSNAPTWSTDVPTATYSDPYSIAFDGTNDYVSLGSTNTFIKTGKPFTFTAWVKLTSFTGNFYPKIAILKTDTTNPWEISFSNDINYLGISIGSTNTWAALKTDQAANTLTGAWHHVAVTYNGSGDGTAANFKIYFNGVPQAKTSAGSIGALSQNSYIGGNGAANNNWNGAIDDVAVYDRELTGFEIAAMASGQKQPRVPSNTYEKNLFGLWYLDNDVIDSSGTRAAGSLAGNAAYKPGLQGPAVTLDGTGDYVSLGTFTFPNNLTISAWANLSAVPADNSGDTIVGGASGANYTELYFWKVTSGSLQLKYTVDNGISHRRYWAIDIPSSLVVGNWHHYAVTQAGPTATPTFYIDGQAYTPGAPNPTAGTPSQASLAVAIGADGPAASGEFKGLVDEVAVFNAVLTASEIADVYKRGAAKLRIQARTSAASDMSSATGWSGGGIPDKGLVALWRMNESSGTAIADSSGSSFNGTATNAPIVGASGKVGNGITFDGVDDYVTVADNAAQRPTNVTVGCWFKTTQTSLGAMVNKPRFADGQAGYSLVVNLTANKVSMYGVPSGATKNAASVTSVNDGLWHHAVGVCDGSSYKIYVDGVLETTLSSATIDFVSTYPIGIGALASGFSHFNGTLDEVFIYDRALTGTEIWQLYQSGNYITNLLGETLTGLNPQRYAQYRALYDSAAGNHVTADLQAVTIHGASSLYSTANPSVVPATGQAFTYLTSFAETVITPASTAIKYQLSPNNGTNWYYHNGTNWVTSDGTYAQSAAASVISTNITGFDDKAYSDGNLPTNSTGTLKFRAFLNTTDAAATPQLDTLNIGYETGSLTVTSPNGSEAWKVGSAKSITWSVDGIVPSDLIIEYSKDNFIGNVNTIATGVPSADSASLSGAVCVWRLNDSTASSIIDSTPNAYNGTNVFSSVAVGKFANGRNGFNAGPGFYHTTNVFSLAGDITIATWFKHSSIHPTDLEYLMSLGVTTGGPSLGIYVVPSTGQIRCPAYGGPSANITTGGSYNDGQWHHAVVTRSGTNYSLYIDGTLINTVSGTQPTYGKLCGSGSIADNYFGFTTGSLDEIAVFNRALTITEIRGLSQKYDWTVPNDPSDSVKVRVRSSSAPSIRDSSNANFTIAGLDIVAPNGGEYWKVGSTQNVKWAATVGVPNDLDLSYYNGSGYTSFASGLAATGTLPNLETDPASIANDIGVWRMTEGTGQTVADGSGSGNTGTLGSTAGADANDPTWSATGKWGNALSFDGVDDYLKIPDNPSVSITGTGLTLAAWVKPTSGNAAIIHKDNHYSMAVISNSINYADSISWSYATFGNQGSVPAGQWSHIAVTFDGSIVRFFVNGIQVGSSNRGGSLTDNAADLYIGKYDPGGISFLGLIDDAAIYNRALTTAEIVSLAGGQGYPWTVQSDAVRNNSRIQVKSAGQATLLDQSDATLTIYAMDITAPNTAVTWPVGSSKTITWTHNGLPGSTVKLELSTDGGTNWLGTAIATGVAKGAGGNGTYTWNSVSNNPTTQARVRVVDETAGSVVDVSDANFTISGSIISVTSPTGSSVWPVTSTQSIKWSVDGSIPGGGTVRISYSTDGTNYTTVTGGDTVDATTGAAGFNWPVPLNAASSTARIKVEDNPAWSPAATDGISAQYSVSAFVAVLKPNGSERWATGQPHNITWQTQGTVANVKIEYSTAGSGGPWTEIIASTGNDGSHSWTPAAGLAGTNTMVRVSNAADAGANDRSDSAFILSSVAVTAPTASAVRWLANSAQTVTWSSVGGMSNVKLQYSTAGSGGPWTNFTESEGTTANDGIVANDGTFSWTVPLSTTTGGFVQVTDADSLPGANGTDTALATDSSDNAFAIIGTIDVTAPDTNLLDWPAGQAQTITWTISPANVNVIPNVKIEVIDFIDGNNTKFITNSTPAHNVAAGSGSFSWSPDFTTTNAKVKIYDANDNATFNQADNAVKFTGISMNLPAGGETWTVGTQQVIKFGFTAGTMTQARVEHSPDGSTYTVASAGSLETSSNGTDWTPYGSNGNAVPVGSNPFWLRWTVADAISSANQARIKITNPDNSAYATTNGFTITGALSMTTPGTLTVNDSATISWTKTGTIGTVKVEFSPSGNFSGDIQTVGTGLTGTSTNWTVPDNIGLTGKLRVTDTVSGHPATSSTSNAFAIKGAISITAPSSSTWQAASSQTITWLVTGTMTNVKIEYLPNGGAWTAVTESEGTANDGIVAHDGTFTWLVPDIVATPQSTPTKTFQVRITDSTSGHTGAAQVVTTSGNSTIAWYLVTFNVTNADGQNLATLDVADSIDWAATGLTSPTATKRYYKYSATETATWSKTNFTASTVNFTPDAAKTVAVVLDSETPTAFSVELSTAYSASADTLSLSTSLSKAGVSVSGVSLGTGTIVIYGTNGTTVLATLTQNTPLANGLYVFTAFDPDTYSMLSGNSYPAKCTILYNSVAKSSMRTINFTAEKSVQTLVNRIGGYGDDSNDQTLFGEIAATKSASQAAQTAAQAAQTAIGTSTDAAGAATVFGQVKTGTAQVMASLGTLADGGSTQKTLQDRLGDVETEVNKKSNNAELLSRTIQAAPGETAVIRFRTETGLVPVVDVYDPDNKLILDDKKMKEIKSTGVYEYDWMIDAAAAKGDYTVIITEPTKSSVDSMSVKVASESVDNSSSVGASQSASAYSQKTLAAVEKIKSDLDSLMAKLETTTAGAGGAVSPETAKATLRDARLTLDSGRSQAQSLADSQGIELGTLLELTQEQKTKMAEQAGEIKVMKDHVVRMKAILDALKMASGAEKPVIQNWMETGSIILKSLAINPSKELEQEADLRLYLPTEAKPENVLNRDEIELDFDPERSLFFARKKVKLKPGETYTLQVHIEDIWLIGEERLEKITDRARTAIQSMEGSSLADVAKILYDNVSSTVKLVRTRQADDTLLPEAHIAAYRMNLKLLEDCEKDLNSLESLTLQSPAAAKAARGLGGDASAGMFGSTALTWKIMLAIVIFLGLLSAASFMVWNRQVKAMVAPREINTIPPEARDEIRRTSVDRTIKDTLTGLFSAAQLRVVLKQEIETADVVREKKISVVILDIDHFKRLNESVGHLAGDQALKSLSQTLRGLMRKNDAVFRYGGEEFALYLSDTSVEEAQALAEKMRLSIEKMTFIVGEAKSVQRLTASFGVASYHSKEGLEPFLARVEKALALAKTKGRNQVQKAPVPLTVTRPV